MKKLLLIIAVLSLAATAYAGKNFFFFGLGGGATSETTAYERLYDSGATSLEDSDSEDLYSTEIS